MRTERRNFRTRADTMRRVLTWIRAQNSPVVCVPRHLATPEAGVRMLKQLAIRGLLRSTAEGWVPQPSLLNPPPLVEPDES